MGNIYVNIYTLTRYFVSNLVSIKNPKKIRDKNLSTRIKARHFRKPISQFNKYANNKKKSKEIIKTVDALTADKLHNFQQLPIKP